MEKSKTENLARTYKKNQHAIRIPKSPTCFDGCGSMPEIMDIKKTVLCFSATNNLMNDWNAHGWGAKNAKRSEK